MMAEPTDGGRLLLAVDLDEPVLAVEPVVRLARAAGWPIRLLHVMPTDVALLPGDSGPGATVQRERREARTAAALEQLRCWAQELASEGVVVESVLTSGPVVETILATAATDDVTVIALVGHRHHVAHRVLLGSVVGSVLRRASVPVFVVPPPGDRSPALPSPAAASLDQLRDLADRLPPDAEGADELRGAWSDLVTLVAAGESGDQAVAEITDEHRATYRQLLDGLHRLEVEHPRLTRTVNDVAYHLSGMGL